MQTDQAILGWQYEDFRTDAFISSYLASAVRAYPLNPDTFSIADLAIPSIERMIDDCHRFKTHNKSLLILPGINASRSLWQAGADFWTVRNCPQCDFPLKFWQVPNGPLLTKAARAVGACRLFVGLDGLIYVSEQEDSKCVGG